MVKLGGARASQDEGTDINNPDTDGLVNAADLLLLTQAVLQN